jgi:hypothetical protein
MKNEVGKKNVKIITQACFWRGNGTMKWQITYWRYKIIMCVCVCVWERERERERELDYKHLNVSIFRHCGLMHICTHRIHWNACWASLHYYILLFLHQTRAILHGKVDTKQFCNFLCILVFIQKVAAFYLFSSFRLNSSV